jgi:hypothetical protein
MVYIYMYIYSYKQQCALDGILCIHAVREKQKPGRYFGWENEVLKPWTCGFPLSFKTHEVNASQESFLWVITVTIVKYPDYLPQL